LPVATVVATHDKLVHPDRQRRLTRAWQAHPVILGADHDAPVACPERFAAAMLTAIEHVAQTLIVPAEGGVR
jgi:pimeloyl-ACP methyl ester carboxylesterase